MFREGGGALDCSIIEENKIRKGRSERVVRKQKKSPNHTSSSLVAPYYCKYPAKFPTYLSPIPTNPHHLNCQHKKYKIPYEKGGRWFARPQPNKTQSLSASRCKYIFDIHSFNQRNCNVERLLPDYHSL